MPFKLIRGTFHVTNYSPDGDSIRFGPDDLGLLASLSGPPASVNSRRHVQLRIEAIDSLETHYSAAGGGTYHQPLELALDAAEGLIDFAAITNVVWDSGHRSVVSADDGTRGYIASRSVEKNRRPVAFVFAGDPPEADGADIFLGVDRLLQSYNLLRTPVRPGVCNLLHRAVPRPQGCAERGGRRGAAEQPWNLQG